MCHWPADSAEVEVELLNTLEGHQGSVEALAISPDGKLLVSGGDDQNVKLWSLPAGSLRNTLAGHENGVSALAISPDGKLLASGSSDCTVKLWSLPAGSLRNTLARHQYGVDALAISPDGKLLASGSWDQTVKLWSLPDGALLKTLAGHQSYVSALAISPDSKLLVSGSGDVELWSLPDGALLKTLEGPQDRVSALAISPDGKLLASGSGDQTVKLWSLPDGTLLKTLTGHQNWVSALAISPDGKLLTSGSRDQTVKLWSLPDGTLLKTLTGHQNWVSALAISPDSKLLASGSRDQTVKLWSLAGGLALIDVAEAGGFSWPDRCFGGLQLLNATRAMALDFVGACARVVFSWPSLVYSGGLVFTLALPYWLRGRKRRQIRHGVNVWVPWVWVPWGFAWVAMIYGLVYGPVGIVMTLSCGGALVVVAWFNPQRVADFGARPVVWFLWVCALALLVNGLLRGGPLAVAAMLVMATFVAFPKWMRWWIRRPYWAVPGMGGWLVLGWVWVVLLLYGVILRWNWGSVVFLTIALIPAWLVVLVAIATGLARWPKARQRASRYVCRDDFQRFVIGPSLSWVQRWSGRWLWREHNAPKDMADSCVCPACGKDGRFDGVLEIVAVLDNSAGTFDSRQHNGTLQVNWLQHQQPFDFDRVEVFHATDDEVEEFVRQTRFDSDPRLQRRLPKMECVVNAQCHFQRTNTMTILRQTFGNVTQD